MAAVRLTMQAPVGSVQWILDEEDFANQFVRQEVDDFAFSAYNELEWLNEHMAEVFNRTELYGQAQCRVRASELIKGSSDVAEVFKTPGKLRGKTPKTVRKRNPLETRAVSEAQLTPGRALLKSPPIAFNRHIFSNTSIKNKSLPHYTIL